MEAEEELLKSARLWKLAPVLCWLYEMKIGAPDRMHLQRENLNYP
jgi:hypothetical protein